MRLMLDMEIHFIDFSCTVSIADITVCVYVCVFLLSCVPGLMWMQMQNVFQLEFARSIQQLEMTALDMAYVQNECVHCFR